MINYWLVLSLLLLLGSPLYARQADQECLNWFKAGKIEIDKNCEPKCAALPIDMGTFNCPEQCDLLCQQPSTSKIVGIFIFYPGLTPAEKQLLEKYSKDALIVFIQKTLAESSTNRNFPDQGLNDESDAFRHFIWAALLTKELGKTKTKEFLDAHEANPLQSASEKEMDAFNNEKGIRASEQNTSESKWSLEQLEATGLEELRNRGLRVLKPGLKIPEKPK